MTKIAKNGRPSIALSEPQQEQLKLLVGLGCTHEELAVYYKTSTKTIQRWAAGKYKKLFETGKATLHISLRRELVRKALNGDTTSLIFLAKTVLGMKEKSVLEHTDPEGSPLPQVRIYLPDNGRDDYQTTPKGD